MLTSDSHSKIVQIVHLRFSRLSSHRTFQCISTGQKSQRLKLSFCQEMKLFFKSNSYFRSLSTQMLWMSHFFSIFICLNFHFMHIDPFLKSFFKHLEIIGFHNDIRIPFLVQMRPTTFSGKRSIFLSQVLHFSLRLVSNNRNFCLHNYINQI